MKTCWQILGIEATTEADTIRQAYLALLPSFHPETDPQGFKQLREAYDAALQEAKTPTTAAVEDDPDISWVNYQVALLYDFLADGEHRFQPSSWQHFIQQINKLPIPVVEKSRWPLCAAAMKVFPISYTCLRLLSERLSWGNQDHDGQVDDEELEHFLHDIHRGDLFDYAQLQHLPVAVQNQTIECYQALEVTFFSNPRIFSQLLTLHGAWVVPSDLSIQRRLVRWHSTCHYGIAELLPVAQAWQKDDPECGGYYQYAQRVFCREGESLLPELCAYWQEQPSTQADELLLRWCRLHRPDSFPLLVMAIEAREQVDINGEPLLYIPGSSARTYMLWAEALQYGRDGLSALSESFIVRRLKYGAATIGEEHSQHPFLPLYQAAERLASAEEPDEALLQRLIARLDIPEVDPLEGIIIRALLVQAAAVTARHVEADEGAVTMVAPQSSEQPGGSFGLWQVIKIIFFIGVIGHLLSRFMH